MKKILLVLIFTIIILTSSIFAYNFSPDSKLTKIYPYICDKEISMLKVSKLCDGKTPSNINVDFDKDSKTNAIKINAEGVLKNLK